jgi:hypothetical protein
MSPIQVLSDVRNTISLTGFRGYNIDVCTDI